MALNIGNKVYRNLQEQVGYNSEQIDKIFSILDGIDYEDHVVVIEDISTPLTADELAIANEAVSFLVYQDKLYFKDHSDSDKLYFSAVVDINDSGEITFSSYQISVDSVSGEMAVINTTSEVYSTDEVDDKISSLETLISNIPNGSPAGVYASLADLQTAFPTGDNHIYLVSANGHWYYWSGSAWTDGGQYLSSTVFTGLLATNTDLDTVTATSTYMLLATYTYSNLPKPITLTYNWALLETINTVGNNIIQMFTDTGDGSRFYRIKGSGWSSWYYIGSNQQTRNLGVGGVNTNIDNIRNYGIYLLLSTAQGTLPETITTYGMLFVIYASGTSTQQIYSGNSGKLFIRYYNSGVWSEWTELYSNLFPAGYNYPYIYDKGVRCNKANNTVTAYYAGVDCGEGVLVDVNSVGYRWSKAKAGQTSGALALIMNPNGCDKFSQITDLSLHLVLTASHLKVDILGNRYGNYYYQNLINDDLINPQSLDGTTGHTVTLVVSSANRIYVYIDGVDTYTGVFTPDANISSLYDVIGRYAQFEHYCNGDMDNYAMPIFKQWIVRQGSTYYVYDNFDRENGQLQNTPQGLPYHLFSTIHNQG